MKLLFTIIIIRSPDHLRQYVVAAGHIPCSLTQRTLISPGHLPTFPSCVLLTNSSTASYRHANSPTGMTRTHPCEHASFSPHPAYRQQSSPPLPSTPRQSGPRPAVVTDPRHSAGLAIPTERTEAGTGDASELGLGGDAGRQGGGWVPACQATCAGSGESRGIRLPISTPVQVFNAPLVGKDEYGSRIWISPSR